MNKKELDFFDADNYRDQECLSTQKFLSCFEKAIDCKVFKFNNLYTLGNVELSYSHKIFGTVCDIEATCIRHHFDEDIEVSPFVEFYFGGPLSIDSVKKLHSSITDDPFIEDEIWDLLLACNDIKKILFFHKYLMNKNLLNFATGYVARAILSKQLELWMTKYLKSETIKIIPISYSIFNNLDQYNESNSNLEDLDVLYKIINETFTKLNVYLELIKSDHKKYEEAYAASSHKVKDKLYTYLSTNLIVTQKDIVSIFEIDPKTIRKILNILIEDKIFTKNKLGTWRFYKNILVEDLLNIYKK